MRNSDANGSEDSDGMRLPEANGGDLDARVTDASITGNDGQAIRFEQEPLGPDVGTLIVANSDLSGNSGALDDRGGVAVTFRNVTE